MDDPRVHAARFSREMGGGGGRKPRVTKNPLSHFMMAIYSAIDCVMTEKGGGRRYGFIPNSGVVTGELLDFAIPNSWWWGRWEGGGRCCVCSANVCREIPGLLERLPTAMNCLRGRGEEHWSRFM